MNLILAGSITSDARIRAVLQSAVAYARPEADSLAQSHPRWEVDRLLRQLRAAGELQADGWQEAARDGYLALLQEPQPVARKTTNSFDGVPVGDRPREKALSRGIEALGDNELLALLLRTGGSDGVMALAERLLSEHDGLLGLAGCDMLDLMNQAGLGPAKATEIAAAFELGRRLARAARGERPSMRSPAEVAAYIGPALAAKQVEEVWCLALDVRCRLIAQPLPVSQGDVDGSEASPRLVFRQAIRLSASSCIIVHNHPTGDPQPSNQDISLTRRLARAGAILGIPLSDHIVIGDGGRWVSIRQQRPELFANTAS